MRHDDTYKHAAMALRQSVVAKAERSPTAVTKQTTGRTLDGPLVQSFHTLIAEHATVTRNIFENASARYAFTAIVCQTPIQPNVLDLLDVSFT